MSTIPITKRGSEKLKEELQRLKHIERPAVVQAIAEARAQGDLSENAEYDAAKDKQGFIEGRIMEIEGKLSAAQVIDPAAVDAGGRVVFGATVDLEDEDSGNAVTYQIVGEDEADLKLDRRDATQAALADLERIHAALHREPTDPVALAHEVEESEQLRLRLKSGSPWRAKRSRGRR